MEIFNNQTTTLNTLGLPPTSGGLRKLDLHGKKNQKFPNLFYRCNIKSN